MKNHASKALRNIPRISPINCLGDIFFGLHLGDTAKLTLRLNVDSELSLLWERQILVKFSGKAFHPSHCRETSSTVARLTTRRGESRQL